MPLDRRLKFGDDDFRFVQFEDEDGKAIKEENPDEKKRPAAKLKEPE